MVGPTLVGGERLAGRRRMDRIKGEQLDCVRTPLERVRLDQLEGVVGLRLDVDPDDLESGPVVAHRCSAGTAEEVEQPHLTTPTPVSTLTIVIKIGGGKKWLLRLRLCST